MTGLAASRRYAASAKGRAKVRRYYETHRTEAIERSKRWKIDNRERYLASTRASGKRRYPAKRGIRTAWIALAKTGGCVDCGERDVDVLDFDHVRGRKSFSVSAGSMRSLKDIAIEIAKCEVRCANCHRRRTAERRRKEMVNGWS